MACTVAVVDESLHSLLVAAGAGSDSGESEEVWREVVEV